MAGYIQEIFNALPDLAGAILAVLGVVLLAFTKDVKKLESTSHKTLRWILAISVIVIGAGGVVSSQVQKWRDEKAKQKLNGDIDHLKDEVALVEKKLGENQNATVGLNMLVPLNGVQELIPDEPIKFNLGYVVATNTAKNLRGWEDIVSESGTFSSAQARKVWLDFMPRAAPRLLHIGEDRVVGTGNWGTVSLVLSKRQIDEVVAGHRMIYILGRQEWTNLSGSDGHIDTCKRLEQPKTKYLGLGNIAWHDCEL
jgi:hypothetical protein